MGRVSKLRLKLAKNDENTHRGAIVLDGSLLSSSASSSLACSRRSKSAALIQSVSQNIAKVGRTKAGEKRLLQLIDENTR